MNRPRLDDVDLLITFPHRRIPVPRAHSLIVPNALPESAAYDVRDLPMRQFGYRVGVSALDAIRREAWSQGTKWLRFLQLVEDAKRAAAREAGRDPHEATVSVRHYLRDWELDGELSRALFRPTFKEIFAEALADAQRGREL